MFPFQNPPDGCCIVIPVLFILYSLYTYAMRFLKVLPLLFIAAPAFAVPKAADTIKLYFDIGVAKLSPASQHIIDSLVYYEKLVPGKKLGIVGYADFLGSEESNVGLSENRAKNVQAYLTGMGIKAEDIQTVIGKGEVRRDGMTDAAGYPTDRRVDIIPGGFKVTPPPPPVPVVKPLIDLSTVKKNETIKLDRIFFEPGSHMLKPLSKPTLDKLLAIMKENPTLKIQIEGHICCIPADNTDGYDFDSQEFQLSVNRAKAVYDYLAKNGIQADRMKYKGFGKTKPLISPEVTEEDENMNRRVEIRILEK